jgi:hypothetical protein
MSIFFPINDPTNQLQARLKTLIEVKYGAIFNHQSFIQTFNRDINVLETLIVKPPQEDNLYNIMFEKQEAHYKKLKEAQENWETSGKAVSVGARAVHELNLKTKEFNCAKKKYECYLDKKNQIKEFVQDETPWNNFRALISFLPNSTQLQVKSDIDMLEKYWKMQGELAIFDSDDLDILEEELAKIQELLNFVIDVIPKDSNNEYDKTLLLEFSKNKNALEELNDKKIACMAWKIKASSKKKCMWVDDTFSMLCTEMQALFKHLRMDDFDAVKPYMKIASNSFSRNFSPDKFGRYVEKIEQSSAWHNFSLQSYWAQEDEGFTIPFEMIGHHAVPKAMRAYIPDTIEWAGNARLRHAYFRSQDQTVMKINECVRQMDLLKSAMGIAKSLKLEFLTDTPGFKSALMVRKIIQQERERASYHQPSWTMGVLLKSIPFFNRSSLYQFISCWLGILSDVETKTHAAGREISSLLVHRLGGELLVAIRDKSDLFPANLIKDIKLFIKWYGSEEDSKLLDKIFDPLEMFSRFKFLKTKNSDYKREIDIESISMFLSFSEKYWTESQFKAAKILTLIIKGEWYPSNIDEERYLAQSISSLLPETDRGQAFKTLMECIAQKYIDKTGDRSNEFAYRFLQRYSPETAARWQKDRQSNLEYKYALLNKILSVSIHNEIPLYGSDAGKQNDHNLSVNNFTQYLHDLYARGLEKDINYINLLVVRAKQYVENYCGDNVAYAGLICEMATLSDDSELFKDYARKRMLHFSRRIQSGAKVELTELDYHLFHGVRFKKDINELFIEMIDGLSAHLDSPSLFDWVETSCQTVVKEHYRIKRIEQLLQMNDLKKTQSFAQAIVPHTKESDSGKLINTRSGNQKLQAVYSAYLSKISAVDDWQGNAFVVMASFSTHLMDKNIEYLNYLWLREYLLYPEHFNPDYDGERSSLDYKFHRNNLSVPNDDKGLADFYGDSFAYVKPLIVHYFINFKPFQNAEQLPLIRAYLNEREFQNDNDSVLLLNMLQIVEYVNSTYTTIQAGSYDVVSSKIEQLMLDYQTAIDLSKLSPSFKRTEELTFFKNMLIGLGGTLSEHFKSIVISDDMFEQILCDPKANYLPQLDSLHSLKTSERMLSPLPQDLAFIECNAKKTIDIMCMLFNPEIQSITLEVSDAIILSKMLTQERKDVIAIRIKQLFTCLQDEPVQWQAAKSYIKILNNQFSDQDIINIKQYKVIKRDLYPKLAGKLVTDMIAAMREGKDLSAVFETEKHARMFYDHLANYLDPKSLNRLSQELALKIKLIADEDVVTTRKDCRIYGEVYRWLVNKGCLLESDVNSKIQTKLRYLSKHYFDSEQEEKLMDCALFIRSFGNEDAIAELENKLETLAGQQRLLMLRNVTDTSSVQFIEYINRMMLLVGTPSQIKKSAELINRWSQYRQYSCDLMASDTTKQSQELMMREEIIDQAFDACLIQIERDSLHYFIEALKISDINGFHQEIEAFVESLRVQGFVDGYYIETNRILEKYDYTFFKALLEKYAAKDAIATSFSHLYSNKVVNVTERDGLKLLVTLLFGIRIPQAKEAWREQLQVDRENALLRFDPKSVIARLEMMSDELISAFKLGQHDFTKNLKAAIKKSETQFDILSMEATNDRHYGWLGGWFSKPSVRL